MRRGRKVDAGEKHEAYSPEALAFGRNGDALRFAKAALRLATEFPKRRKISEPEIAQVMIGFAKNDPDVIYDATRVHLAILLADVMQHGDAYAVAFFRAVARHIQVGHHRQGFVDPARLCLSLLPSEDQPQKAEDIAAFIQKKSGVTVSERWVRREMKVLGMKVRRRGRS